jgi:hypothetical protein
MTPKNNGRVEHDLLIGELRKAAFDRQLARIAKHNAEKRTALMDNVSITLELSEQLLREAMQ